MFPAPIQLHLFNLMISVHLFVVLFPLLCNCICSYCRHRIFSVVIFCHDFAHLCPFTFMLDVCFGLSFVVLVCGIHSFMVAFKILQVLLLHCTQHNSFLVCVVPYIILISQTCFLNETFWWRI